MSQTAKRPGTGAEDIAWDLTIYYSGHDDPRIDADLKAAHARAEALATHYKGRIADLSPADLHAMIEEYEGIVELGFNAAVYAQLYWSIDTGDAARGALLMKANEQNSQLQQALVFVDLELANAPAEQIKAWLAADELAGYRHWIEVQEHRKPFLLTEPEERILAEKSVTGAQAWDRLFDQLHSHIRYEWQGEQVPLEAILNQLYSPERETRKAAQESITAGLRDNLHITGYIFNTILADKASTDRLRSYPTWVSSRNMANEVDDASVESMVEAITGRYDIVARYYKLKANLLGYDELFDYDRYAPLPDADKFVTWSEARNIVLGGYARFSEDMAEIASHFFEKNWIDGPVRPGKRGGAYSMPSAPGKNPYVLMNYEGRLRDVETLAHELGHGIHQYLAREQGLLLSDTPLTTAETASVFGEMLIFQDLLLQEDDPRMRLGMLTGKLESSFATVFRQTAMNRFEGRIHTHRREQGELAVDDLNKYWMETQEAMFEGSVTLTDNYGIWWSYIPHFIGVPGYVYAYAYGELLVLALYARYQSVGAGFADGYIEMLRAGGSDWPHEIVKPLGVDLKDPGFWDQGLAILDEMVSDAEKLAQELGY